ncbi:MAG: transcription elongation factor GreA [Thermodesulfobacteriota bacterium]
MDNVPITKAGYDRLYEELERLRTVELQKNAGQILKAREFGDISENSEYTAAKEQQAFLSGRIQKLQEMLSSVQIVPTENLPSDRIVFGSKVKLEEVDTGRVGVYQLVGPYESAPDKGLVSVTSPIGKALVGRAPGDVVELKTPGGTRELEILEILP